MTRRSASSHACPKTPLCFGIGVPVRSLLVLSPLLVASPGCSSDASSAPDGGGDQDGIKGGSYTFVVMVDDTQFSPAILKAQNDAMVTLTLTNTGTRPHDLTVDGMPAADVAAVMPAAQAISRYKFEHAGQSCNIQVRPIDGIQILKLPQF